MTRLLARLLVGLPLAVVVATAHLLVLVVRLGLWLLGRVGFRGARLAGLAATLAGVWWAAGHVGVGPAARLAVIGWAAWAARHHQAAIARHAAVRRLAAAQQAAVRRLTAALEQHTGALAAASGTLPARPTTPAPAPATATTATPAAAHQVPAAAPWPAADQPPNQAVSALGRYAAAWVRRHTPPAASGDAPAPPIADSHRRQPR
jgi:hypothetical protein